MNQVKLLAEAADGLVRRRKKPAHQSSVNRAALHIRALIVQGRMAPGAWIVEERLCEQLQMSRTPVHLALYLLRSEGYVVEQRSRENSHMMVAAVTREDAAELCLVLGRLEGLAGCRAAELPLRERRGLALRLKDLNDRLAGITTPNSVAGHDVLEIYRQFHRLLMEAGSGPRLKALHRAIEPQAERYWRIYSPAIFNDLSALVEERTEIVAGLKAGDADRVERAVALCWSNGRRRLTQAIEVLGEHGNW